MDIQKEYYTTYTCSIHRRDKMIRDILTNKWIIGAPLLLLIFATGCVWFYQHTTAPYKAEAEETDKLLQQWKTEKETHQQKKR